MKKYSGLLIIGLVFIGLQIGGTGARDAVAATTKLQIENAEAQARRVKQIIVEKAADTAAQNQSITGTLGIFYGEDFKHPENAKTVYKVKAGNRSYTLRPSAALDLPSGTTVKVTGTIADGTITASASNVVSVRAAAPVDSIGDQKTLFILVNYLNSPPTPKTPEEIYDLTFHGQFQKFYAEQSYGKVNFVGDVRGWYTIPRNDDCSQIDLEGPEFAELVTRNNLDIGRYDRLVLVSNSTCSPYSGVSSNGKFVATIDGQQHFLSAIWISIGADSFSTSWSRDITNGVNRYPFAWSVWDYIISHEMGHSLGVAHANGWDCGSNVLYDSSCRHVEYGNNFDAMGMGLYGLHFNAFYKELLGWLSPRDTLRINASGRYTLSTIEDVPVIGMTPASATSRVPAVPAPASGKKFAAIQIPGTGLVPFYVEYRKAAGFDGGLNRKDLFSNQDGLFVNRIINASYTRFPRLLDLQPTSAVWDIDLFAATLNRSASSLLGVFRDEQKGITIGPVVATTPTSITFDVKIDPVACVRNKPTITNVSAPSSLTQGAAGDIVVWFKNADSYVCDSSRFTLVSDVPASWHAVTDPSDDITLRPSSPDEPGNTGLMHLRFTVPANATPGMRQIKLSALNKNSNVSADRTINLMINEVPLVTSVEPRLGPVDTEVTIRGSQFTAPVSIGMSSDAAYAWVTPSFADATTIRFTIPSSLTGFDCGCATPTTPGVYELFVFTNTGYSESLSFEVVGSPTDKPVDASPNAPSLRSRDGTRKKASPALLPAKAVEAAVATADVIEQVESVPSENVELDEKTEVNLFEKGKELGATAFSGFISAIQALLFE